MSLAEARASEVLRDRQAECGRRVFDAVARLPTPLLSLLRPGFESELKDTTRPEDRYPNWHATGRFRVTLWGIPVTPWLGDLPPWAENHRGAN